MIAEDCWALVPLKDMLQAKQRLRGILSVSERRDLFLAMVQDLLEKLSSDALLGRRVLLVSDDPVAELLAESHGVVCIPEQTPGAGLNSAIRAGVDWLTARKISSVMIIHGDLPLIKSEEVRKSLESHRQIVDTPKLSLVSDRAGTGTNCLLLTPPDAISPRFGTNSRRQHLDAAEEAGVAAEELAMESLQFDVDEPADLRELSELLNQHDGESLAPRTAEVLRQSVIRERIRAMDREFAESQAGVSSRTLDGSQ